LIYVFGAFPTDGTYFPRRWSTAAAMYGLMGLAVLAKGPVGAVLPTAVIGMFLLIVRLPEVTQPAGQSAWRRWLLNCLRPFAPLHFFRTCWSMRPLTAVAVVLAVAAPWYAWVGWRTDGEFLRVFFWDHNLSRAAQPMEGHAGGPWFYPVAILVGFFPWSVFTAPVLADVAAVIRGKASWAKGCLFAVCWIGVYVGLFSLARTKLPSYVTPCYPALALLTACFVQHWTHGAAAGWRRWPGGAIVTLGVVGLVIAIAMPLAAWKYLPGETWLAAIGLIPLAGAAIAFVFQRGQRVPQAAWTFAATAVAFTTAVFSWAAVRVDRHQQNQVLLAAINRAGGSPRVGAYGRLEPTWIFYGGRPIDELTLDSPGTEPTQTGTWKPRPRLPAAEFFSHGRDRFIITTDRRWDQLRAVLPPAASILAECPLFLRRERLLLVGVASPGTRTARVHPEAVPSRH
jgi:4-amino-4-deoxy-L-arabinose transferase-like glycosyltransferase